MNMNYQQYHDSTGATINRTITLPIPANAYGKDIQRRPLRGRQHDRYIRPNTAWFGTSQVNNLIQPVLLCDPRKGLKSGQYFNPNCFAAPLPPTATSYGQFGQAIWPYIRNPHYFGSDLAVFKAFRVTDAQRVEVRISATNWLNHPNAQFGLAGNADNSLLFNGPELGCS